jgi:hypothetical protein
MEYRSSLQMIALATNDSLQYILLIAPNFMDDVFTDFILWPQCPLARRVRLAQLCNDLSSIDFGQACCLMFHPFPVAIHQIK